MMQRWTAEAVAGVTWSLPETVDGTRLRNDHNRDTACVRVLLRRRLSPAVPS